MSHVISITARSTSRPAKLLPPCMIPQKTYKAVVEDGRVFIETDSRDGRREGGAGTRDEGALHERREVGDRLR